MKIYLGADHRGFELKEKIKKFLVEENYEFEDLGAISLDPKDDYTLYAEKVAVIVGHDDKARGILLCGSGVGVDIAANKFDGVRSSIGINSHQVEAGRRDDDMNILVIAADYTTQNMSIDMIKKFLETDFSGKARHKRRIDEIARIEENN